MRAMLLSVFAASAVLAACATEPRPAPEFTVLEQNASVNARDVEVRSWGVDNSILIQSRRDDWYRGVLMGGCTNAGFGSFGFVTDSGDSIDRGTEITVQGQVCPMTSFDKIAEPPPGSRR